MDIQEFCRIAGGALVLLLFVPFVFNAIKTGGAGNSFATWLLWSVLDTVNALSLWMQHGNYPVAVGFAIGGIVMTIALLYQGRYGWNRFDTVILVLVIACMVAWGLGGPRAATVSATLAIFIAGIPGIVELWRNPSRALGNLWGWYIFANALSYFGGRANTIEERFPPVVFALYSVIMWIAGKRQNKPVLAKTDTKKALAELEK